MSAAVAEPPTTRHVCAWCPDHQRLLAESEARGFRLSHGLCVRHHTEILREVHDEHQARQARRSETE